MSKPAAKIFLVDDHPLVREWLTNLIHQQPDLSVCGEAETAPEALESISRLKLVMWNSEAESTTKPKTRSQRGE